MLSAAQATGLYARSRALILGVSQYQAPWPVLRGVAQDVAEVSAALEEHEFELTTVLDPDRQTLIDSLETFLLDGAVDARDRLLVYFAGHGYTREIPQGAKMGYLVPVDAPHPDAPDFRRRAVALDRIHQFSLEVAANHVLFLFDSCFSGELFERFKSRGLEAPASIEEHVRRPVRQYITSGEAEESVPDRSIFRGYFVQALHGEADRDRDGFFTATQLWDYLFDKVVVKSKKQQHPQHAKAPVQEFGKGDFVFEVPPRWLARRARMPRPPAVRPAFDQLEQAASAIEPERRDSQEQWRLWQEDMDRDFQKGVEFEERDVPKRFKIAFWTKFLGGYTATNPHSRRDEELRDQARRRLEALERDAVDLPRRSACSQPGEVREESSLRIRFRSVLPGRFRMGSPSDEDGRNADEMQHDVRLTSGFWISETMVTQGQWLVLMGDNPSHFGECGKECPVESVSWYSAVLFANRLSESSDLEPCYELVGHSDSADGRGPLFEKVRLRSLGCTGFRLPTEAEWEFAARAGSSTAFWMGNELTTDQANFDGSFPYRDSSDGVFRQRPTPVRTFEPNPWGLYDVHGNVAEWVWDHYGGYPSTEVIDPRGPEAPTTEPHGGARVIRGGGWIDDAASCRSADRLSAAPAFRDSNVGFRVVRSFRE